VSLYLLTISFSSLALAR